MAALKKRILALLRLRLLWRLALLISIAAILFLATTDSAYPIPASASDKINHIIAFAELTLLARLSWPESRAWLYAPMLLSFGLGIEVIQAYLPYRDFSWADLLADGVGIAVGLLPWPGFGTNLKADLRNSPESL